MSRFEKIPGHKPHLSLLHEAKISPVIQNRSMWKENFERMLPDHDGNSNIVYDEAATVYCYDKVSEAPVRHRMACIGHDPSAPCVYRPWFLPTP